LSCLSFFFRWLSCLSFFFRSLLDRTTT
jgi:hypothetical protein